MLRTDGINSATSLSVGNDNFLALVSEKKGAINIYKYDHQMDNYINFQELNERSRSRSVTTIYLNGKTVVILGQKYLRLDKTNLFFFIDDRYSDAFLCVGASDDEVIIYKYRYIEVSIGLQTSIVFE